MKSVPSFAARRTLPPEALSGAFIRPIVLFQATAKNGEVPVETLKAYLTDTLKIPEEEIRIATGDQKEMLAFVERWIRLYRGEGRKWLAHGRELHPPKIDCESVAYHENFRGTEIDNVKPVVFGTAWEAADGTRALMFANATPYEQKIAYRWKGAWTRATMQPHELRLVPVAK